MIPYKLQIAILQIDMAAANFAGDGQQKSFKDLICSLDLTPGLHAQLTFILVLNSTLSVAAFLGNVLILIAVHKLACVASVSVQFGSKELQGDEWSE